MGTPHVWLKEKIEAVTAKAPWPVGMTGNDSPPFVIYAREATSLEQVLADTFDDTPVADEINPIARFMVGVYADDYVEAWTLADQISAAIHKFSGTAGGTTIEYCMVLDKRDGQPEYLEGHETPTFTVEISVEIRWSE